MFKLEVLKAKYGDCLILHFGDATSPRRVLIDGGPSWTYENSLEPRLRVLKTELDQSVSIELLMVSHIDVDHIGGVNKLIQGLAEARDDHLTPLVDIVELWHNSFADIVPERTTTSAQPAGIELADLGGKLPGAGLSEGAKLVLAGVKHGRLLRQLARREQIQVNHGMAGGLVLAGTELSKDNLKLRVLGPGREEVENLRKEWDKKVREILEAEAAVAQAAERELDGAVANVSSIVVLAEAEGRRMLLTGDGRGDRILEELDQSGLLDGGSIHVDLYKWPHHGSIRNIPENFFRHVTADHHVVSADGRHGNPDLETFEQFFAERPRERPFTLHMTYGIADLRSSYPKAKLEALFTKARNEGHVFDVNTPQSSGQSLTVDLSLSEN